MRRRITVVIWILNLTLVHVSRSSSPLGEFKTHLLRHYDKDVRPGKVADIHQAIISDFNETSLGQPVQFEISTHCLDIDFERGIIFGNILKTLIWYDDRLTWIPQNHWNITEIAIPSHLLWIPDIVMYNR